MDNKKILRATKWAAVTEICAKLISPITSMILARLLAPEIFGIVASINMIITFADLFTDAGFQKFLIQHEFSDELEKNQYTTVAFWTNLALSIILWIIIFICKEPLAVLVGNEGLGMVLAIAALALPMTSFSSIQMALYKRSLDYKSLFYRKMLGALLPLVITVPIAYLTGSYWALVVGTLAQRFADSIILTYFSKWKPNLFYKFDHLKQMFSFTFWTLLESISIWLTSNIDIFIIGTLLSSYYLGLYKNSTYIVTQIFAIVTSATTPILFSSLCRQQDDFDSFKKTLFTYQKWVSLLVIPMGFGVFLYRDFVTTILLGEQWSEASNFIGLWALTMSISCVTRHYCSESYRAKGMPRVSTLAQLIFLCILVPTIYITAQMSFETFYIARCLLDSCFILIHFVLMSVYLKIYPWQLLNKFGPAVLGIAVMGLCAFALQMVSASVVWTVVSILICIVVYAGVLLMFPSIRKMFISVIKKKLKNSNKKAV